MARQQNAIEMVFRRRADDAPLMVVLDPFFPHEQKKRCHGPPLTKFLDQRMQPTSNFESVGSLTAFLKEWLSLATIRVNIFSMNLIKCVTKITYAGNEDCIIWAIFSCHSTTLPRCLDVLLTCKPLLSFDSILSSAMKKVQHKHIGFAPHGFIWPLSKENLILFHVNNKDAGHARNQKVLSEGVQLWQGFFSW